MYSKIYSGIASGIDGMLITVEADVSAGLPGLSLVGFLSSSVKEAGDRVRTALKNTGIYLPSKKITINLSPADVRKDGTVFDVAIAVSIILAMGEIPEIQNMNEELENTLFMGELCLDGSILPVNGVLSVVDNAVKNGIRRFVVPEGNKLEASLVKGVEIYPVSHMEQVISMLCENSFGTPFDGKVEKEEDEKYEFDLADIKGQEMMKRGVIVAVAGFHNILLTGAAGSGKSMIAKCIPGIMPPLTYEESMELTKIYSVSGKLIDTGGLMKRRPFRSPHQNITETVLCGGGVSPKPGEVTLSNGGVLFLDEFPEFSRTVIESLRSPLEDKKITVSRLRASFTYPARFMLVAARNNCPCGFYPDRKKCRCNAGEIIRYQSRISHPIMDRIDIRLEIKPISYNELFANESGVSSREAREIIGGARHRQELRYKNETFLFNSEVPQGKLREFINLGDSEEMMMREIFEKYEMSARGYFKLIRLARTIADVNDRENITEADIEEAAFFRNAENSYI